MKDFISFTIDTFTEVTEFFELISAAILPDIEQL